MQFTSSCIHFHGSYYNSELIHVLFQVLVLLPELVPRPQEIHKLGETSDNWPANHSTRRAVRSLLARAARMWSAEDLFPSSSEFVLFGGHVCEVLSAKFSAIAKS